MHKNTYVGPRLTMRVGVTGHRPNKLKGVDTDLLRQKAADVLEGLKNLVTAIHADDGSGQRQRAFDASPPALRLVTQLAEGADRFVADAGLQRGYVLDVVLPCPFERCARTFKGRSLKEFERLYHHANVEARTELDTDDALAPIDYEAGGHLALDRSDMLLAVWNQKPGNGPGGTAEIVREAQQRGLVVVLVALDGSLLYWDRATRSDGADGEWIQIGNCNEQDPSWSRLCAKIRSILAPPSDPVALALLDDFISDRSRPGSRAIGYSLMCTLFLRQRFRGWIDYGVATQRDGAWNKTLDAANALGDKEFADRLRHGLLQRWVHADKLANHYAHMYRSAYVSNFMLAACAVLAGLSSVFWWDSLTAKAWAVVVELTLIAIVIITTKRGRDERWHERWLDYRNLAEALWPARLSLLIGSSPNGVSDGIAATPGEAWLTWYVRASVREILPPTATIGPDALKTTLDAALHEEMDSQIRYHRKNWKNLHLLDHRLHVAAETMLWATVASCLIYLALFAGYKAFHIELAKSFKPWATWLGGTLPVFGAAFFGIRAIGDYATAASESKRVVAELEDLREHVVVEMHNPQRRRTEQLLSRLAEIMSQDVKVWGMVYKERSLPAGF